jgi:Tol biopolymer transport system component
MANAATPGTNGRIVFASTRYPSTNQELYSVARDGTGLARLTWSETAEQHPAWSPDGNRIAFGSFAEGRQSIHVINADGNGERRVSPDGYDTDDMEPAWSPDGGQIAFASTRPFNDSWHVWVMNADGSGLRQLTSEFSTSPAWSPDGSRIAYLTSGAAIAVVNVDGSDSRRVTSPPSSYSDERPSWSPDGSRLAFARRLTFGNDPQLYVIDVDGSNELQITSTEGASRFPSWSPDGRHIVFTHINRLSVIDPDGFGMRPLIGEPWGVDLTPDWGIATTFPDPDATGEPTIQIFSPEAGRVYPAGFDVPAAYICESDTSFVVSCVGDVAFGALLDMETTGPRTFTVRATDFNGRTSTKTVSFEVFDWRRPSVTVHTPADGAEYVVGEAVEVDFECADEPGGSGIELCGGELQDGQPLDTSRAGSFTAHFWAVDGASNVTELSVSYRVVDRTPPTITIAAPPEGAVYILAESVVVSYSCEDATSCQGDVRAGALLDTSAVGPRTFTVSARDGSGNVANASRNYRVVYPFSDFVWPASPGAGESMLFRFSLGGDRGLAVVVGATWSRVHCQDGTPLGDASTATGKLTYQTDRYKFLVKTTASWKGSCRQLALTLADGTTHLATVRFH